MAKRPMKRAVTTGKTPIPQGLAQPALRALAGAGLDHLEQLANLAEEDVRKLHGIGPDAFAKLRLALASLGQTFAGKGPPESDVDDYISQFPATVQSVLQKVRATIRRAAPEAK